MIVLLTDFGITDPYVGVMKGVILARVPQCTIVDLTHSVAPFNIGEAAYFLESSYQYFPRGTIFCCVVDPGVGSARRAVAVQTEHYFFVAPDNGLLSLVLEREQPRQIIELNHADVWVDTVSATFHGRDVFAPAAALLALGKPAESIGKPIVQGLIWLESSAPIALANGWRGSVISIDHFGNLITNCTQEHVGTGTTTVHIAGHSIAGIQRTFADVPKGEPIAYIGSGGRVEIALCSGNAARTWNVGYGETVVFETHRAAL